ncbi:peptidase [Sphingomonas sp. Leaf407]|uniref:PepSY-associated TM helix domain-containing protein n=1 Tax=unclassified Sphingomonas TaxID=196159 RepID=UPI0006F2C399|nr:MULTISPECIES: PepSY-associated TM helix domain-containing protein [unclassified Sphingomonas]KQN36916.1 peptidase [Sphingomonas sp. Leaf42]KQT30343.1 peptidase [Sphingomonas sp. Leaf407]
MSKGFRQSQSTLHTWSGLLLGWVLFAVFVAGTSAYWREALNRWARPELTQIADPARVVGSAAAVLRAKAPDAQSWFITVPTRDSAGASVFWVPAAKEGEGKQRRRGRRDTSAFIGADGREGTARETRGGDFFYRFHFDLHYMPVFWARWIVGIAAMFMLVAILTGIVTHKKIFKDFFTLRRGKGQRSWLDGHNASAVLALPFHLMITYTGLVTLMAMLMPWAVTANYSDEVKLFADVFPQAPVAERAKVAKPLVDLAVLLKDGERRLGGEVGYITVFNPGDAAARVTMTRGGTSMLSARAPAIGYDGTTGRLLWQAPAPNGAVVTQGAMVGLHAGRFGDYPLRWLYFLCGIAGSLMVASGLVLWTVKRRERLPDSARAPFGFRLVERLNIGFVAGFPIAMTLYLWANRLLPVDMAKRADGEINAMFAGWAILFAYALTRRPARAWVELLALQAGLLIALPLYNIALLPTGLFASIARSDWVLAGADLTFVTLGAGFGFAAWQVHRFRPKPKRVRSAPAISSDAWAAAE